MTEPTKTNKALRRLSSLWWANVAYLLAVILFGAWVRLTGSGAGCGDHWPLCDGQVIPRDMPTERIIELTHRITSALCGFFAIGLLVATRRIHGKSHAASRAALATLALVIVEGAIGAALVKLELVAGDTSSLRALVIALHLTNTLLLMACATLASFYAGRADGSVSLLRPFLAGGPALALAGLIVTASTGAVTALGDTVFPVGSAEAARAAGHILVQLRVVHPILAVVVSLGLLAFGISRLGAPSETGSPSATSTARWAWGFLGIVIVQVLFGVVNIALAAPGWAQLGHLLLAQGTWMTLILLCVVSAQERGVTLSSQ